MFEMVEQMSAMVKDSSNAYVYVYECVLGGYDYDVCAYTHPSKDLGVSESE